MRSEHFQEILDSKPKVDWFEAISENFMDTAGRPLQILEKIRTNYPIGLHGTSLSIGSASGLQLIYLQKLKELVDRIQPEIVSDHLCWSDHAGKRLFDLLPLPFTEESLKLVVSHVDQLQSFLGRRVLLENVSAYVSFKHSEMPEWNFLNQVAKRSGCGILLDVNNIYVNSFNHGFEPADYLNGIDPEFVFQYHISGHTNQGKFLFDTHVGEIIDPVWDVYRQAVRRFGDVSSLIEWDTEIRSFAELQELNEKSREIAKLVPRVEQSVPKTKTKYEAPGAQYSLNEVQAMFADEMLHKGKTKLAGLLNPQAGDPGIERVGVYADGYPARIREALLEAYPAIHKILGEGAFTELAFEFAKSHDVSNHVLFTMSGRVPRSEIAVLDSIGKSGQSIQNEIRMFH